MADISNPDTYKDSFPSKKQFSCCPLRMSDGRSITDYRPKCIVNYELMEHISEKNLVRSSYETRMYLQSNADTIMENDIKKLRINYYLSLAIVKQLKMLIMELYYLLNI